MIRKILCPTDFSEAGNNAIAYAAKVAKIFSAELVLLNVRVMAQVGPPRSSDNYGAALQKAEETLKALVKEISRAYRISCTSEVKLTMQAFNRIIGEAGDLDTIIVIGSNGAETIDQSIFGSNTYRIVKKAACPVWLVPEKWEYGTPDNLLFIFSDDISEEMKSARPFFEFYQPNLTFLKISKQVLTNIKLAVVKEELRKQLPKGIRFSVESTNAENITEKILERAFRDRTNLLMICYHKKTFMEICKRDIVKTITKQPFLPMLILPENE